MVPAFNGAHTVNPSFHFIQRMHEVVGSCYKRVILRIVVPVPYQSEFHVERCSRNGLRYTSHVFLHLPDVRTHRTLNQLCSCHDRETSLKIVRERT